MTGRQRIDAARETRLWFKEVIVPIFGGICLLMTNDDIRESAKSFVHEKTEKVKSKIGTLIHK